MLLFMFKEYNSEADAQANLAVNLKAGQVEEDCKLFDCSTSNSGRNPTPTLVKAVEEETQIPPQEEASPSEQQPVVVPVSPSDTLAMFFQAEGTLSEAAIPAVTRALEGIEGVTNLKVQIVEGIASVELKKQTTVQATGVASSLVEAIQGSGFKLQTLNLSFEDEEDAASWT
ncbi:uncharacterized protein G2W53_025081 [Senna tora]|uniref:HMA domain-containing protein n=1 Tax=Senna tora TaxID=362788 RepID=A0A834TEB0_9FABA|nr:uncharacterized protein G2W53_025081 [Senna tora]